MRPARPRPRYTRLGAEIIRPPTGEPTLEPEEEAVEEAIRAEEEYIALLESEEVEEEARRIVGDALPRIRELKAILERPRRVERRVRRPPKRRRPPRAIARFAVMMGRRPREFRVVEERSLRSLEVRVEEEEEEERLRELRRRLLTRE